MEELAEQGPLTEGRRRSWRSFGRRLAGRGRKKKDRDVTETGVGGPVADRCGAGGSVGVDWG
ncbi:hypothetical protein [Saccharopolyspora spinosa]|uniref:hypothetical protein n=1 Tax=Saccharopolyspora spinosa TaxID=60894 RepID=UPI00376EDEC4